MKNQGLNSTDLYLITSKEVLTLNYPATCQCLSIATELWKLDKGTQKI